MITLEQHIQKMRQLAEDLSKADGPVFLASNSALAMFSERVFTEGQSSTGQKFSYNSTNPLYVNPSKTFGDTGGLKPPRGKTGKTKFKSGKAHKTTWVESYKDLRQKVGRESAFVNWEANGDLKSDIENNSTMTTRKVGEAEYVIESTKKENADKLRGFYTKYPNVFKLSEKEKQEYYKTFDKEFLALIKERLQ
jgi:hypothetical protein